MSRVDTAWVDVCPVDGIHPAKGRTYDDGRPTFDEVPQLYIDPTECIDCGARVPVCPVTAIFPLDDLPEKWCKANQSGALRAGHALVEHHSASFHSYKRLSSVYCVQTLREF